MNRLTSFLHSQTLKKLLAYALIPLAVGSLFVWKVFYLKECYAFENNDEAAHTFVEVTLAWSRLSAGEFPLINLYNNFGIPMLGDPITLPFAPQAISYLLFPAHIAATLNRLALIALTVSLLTYFYHQRFSFSLAVASVCAGLSVLMPIYNYFSVHYPHQGAVAYFVLVLILQHRLRTNSTIKNLFAVYLALLIFTFGVGLNAFLFGVPFLLIGELFESRFRPDKPFLLFVMLLVAALLPVAPHLAYFFQITPLTARASVNYASALPFTPPRLLADLIVFGNQPEFLQVSLTTYYSLPVIGLAVFGLWKIPDKREILKILLLGCLPILGVLGILAFGVLRDYLPFLKPLDVSRVQWFANVYFLAAVGYALESLRKSAVTFRSTLVAVLTAVWGVGVTSAYIFTHYKLTQEVNQALTMIFIALMVTSVGVMLALRLPKLGNTFGVGVAVLLMSFLPVLDYNLQFVRDFQALQQGKPVPCESFFFHQTAFSANFHPVKFIQAMTPFSRMTAQFDPIYEGALHAASKFNIFGSDGRSIILSKDFRAYVLKKNLARLGGYDLINYYFTSADLDELSRLGIKYVITRELDKFREAGWVLRETDTNEKLNLFENPREISLTYLDQGETVQFISPANISYRGNEVEINLQSVVLDKETDLVLTFVNWPGWKATIDGRNAAIKPAPDQFLRVGLRPENQRVKFTFEPVNPVQFIIFPILSILVFSLAAGLLKFSAPQRLAKNDSG